MPAGVLRPRAAVPVPEEAGEGGDAAELEGPAEDVPLARAPGEEEQEPPGATKRQTSEWS